MARRPGWISKDEDGKDSIGLSVPEIEVQTARYGVKFPSRLTLDDSGKPVDPARDPSAHLYQLITAQFFNDARTIYEWNELAADYPANSINPDQTIQQSNPNVAARAYYLREAISKLLELVKAPAAMASDLKSMLDPLIPDGAEVRAEVQQAILDDPTASLQQIADRTRADAGQISKDGKAGLLRWPADPVRKRM